MRPKYMSIKTFIYKHGYTIILCVIVAVAMYLRFYRIYDTQPFGWDQARDAWKTRDILTGQVVLNGPRTGIGHFHLGSLWYYFLAPFYYFSKLNPISANYLNFIINLFNILALSWVTKKIYSERTAILVTILYSTI